MAESQLSLLRARPTVTKQEFVLAALLSSLGPLNDALFAVTPDAEAGAVRALVSTFAGMEDFACWNANFPRRKSMSSFALSPFRRLCLSCFMRSGRKVIDSEWHAFCDCPLHSASRGRFVLASDVEFSSSLSSTVSDLVPLITSVRTNARKAGLLAKFALDIRSTRRHLFRQLSSARPLWPEEGCCTGRVGALACWDASDAARPARFARFCRRRPSDLRRLTFSVLSSPAFLLLTFL